MRANTGDYIIRGINGEIYPCKSDIFEKTYELVESEDKECPNVIDVDSMTKIMVVLILILINGMLARLRIQSPKMCKR